MTILHIERSQTIEDLRVALNILFDAFGSYDTVRDNVFFDFPAGSPEFSDNVDSTTSLIEAFNNFDEFIVLFIRNFFTSGNRTSIALPTGTTENRYDSSPLIPASIRFNTDINIYEGYNGVYWSSLGERGAFYENDNIISSSFEFPIHKNGVSAGPIEIDVGVVISIPENANWTIV